MENRMDMLDYPTDHLSEDDLRGFHQLSELTQPTRVALAAMVDRIASHPDIAYALALEARASVFKNVDMYWEGYAICHDLRYEEACAASERATAEVTDLEHLDTMRSLMSAGWGNRYATPGSGPDQADLLRRFDGDEAAVKAAQSLRYRFGAMTDRDAGPAWRAAYGKAAAKASAKT